jgi:uncharacterized protein (DUF427 family)
MNPHLRPWSTRPFCPYKGLCSYYDIGDEPDIVSVQLDGAELRLEPVRQ